MAMMQYDLVSPERSLASGQASEVRIPGSEGDMTAMADHAPVITTLRPGVLTIVSDAGTAEYAVIGGFAEVTATSTSVLAEKAMPVAEVTADVLAGLVSDAETALANASVDGKDSAVKYLDDLRSLGSTLGL
ncbi:ATP synthase F1, epsilon subunit [Rhodobacteraceae bacterium HTCC2150]|jgi:F-type H+-transporting ATPase subunit epsilon|nr:ATP synthase F1, epsilon subunit [Rhodobacteraceae bacterium HTCC2150]